jgi:transposase
MPATAVLLFEDETILRLFPVLRRAWTPSGEQASIGISGRNAKQVLYDTINVHTGHRIVLRGKNMSQDGFQKFLRLLRRSYRNLPIWILLDREGIHTTSKSIALAKALDIELIWLPKQCPELNAMDQLWRSVKNDISANYQFSSIDEHTSFAEQYIKKLTNKKALCKAGILSKNFWLKLLCKNFWPLT